MKIKTEKTQLVGVETKHWKLCGIVNLNIKILTQSYSGRESTDLISLDETSL